MMSRLEKKANSYAVNRAEGFILKDVYKPYRKEIEEIEGEAHFRFHLSFILKIYMKRLTRDLNIIIENGKFSLTDIHKDKIDELLESSSALSLHNTLKVLTPNYRKLYKLCRLIISNCAIINVGAGVSFESDINWDIVESILYTLLSDKFGSREDFEKQYNSCKPSIRKRVWNYILRDRILRTKFQEEITKSVRIHHDPSDPHSDLAILFHEVTNILCIISFNWDDLIERAFLKKYNKEISVIVMDSKDDFSDKFMWKPHGCCNYDKGEWILPFEKKSLVNFNPKVKQKIRNSTKAAVFISIGYSGNDKAIDYNFSTFLLNNPLHLYCIGLERISSNQNFKFIELKASEALLLMKYLILKYQKIY